MSDTKPKLSEREYTITVTVVPPLLEQTLFGATVETKQVTIRGYTLKDAKRKAGIK